MPAARPFRLPDYAGPMGRARKGKGARVSPRADGVYDVIAAQFEASALGSLNVQIMPP